MASSRLFASQVQIEIEGGRVTLPLPQKPGDCPLVRPLRRELSIF